MDHPGYGKIKCFANQDYVCERILNGQIWEQDLFEKAFKPFITPDSTVLDCGAYIGSHTILMKQLDRNNTILCVEMMPEQYKILRDNIELNQLNDVLAFNLALGDKVGHIQMPKALTVGRFSNS